MQASIKANPTFTETISIPRPGGEPMKFKGVFKHRTKDQFIEMAKSAKDDLKGDVESVMDVLVDWQDMAEPFNRENVATLLQNYFSAADEIAMTYVRALGSARLGN